VAPVIAVPGWAGAAPAWRPLPLPAEPALPRPLAPSRPENVAMGAVPPSRSPLLREVTDRPAARGSLVHALLQHLPHVPPAHRHAAAEAYAAQAIPAEAARLAGQVVAVLEDPGLADLFGPGSRAEQGLSGVLDGQVITGRVDRLAVLPGRVLVADYKTARTPPARVEAVPVLYLRQMAAYRGILRLIYPGRDIVCVLIWTEGPAAMTLPDAVLDAHVPRAGHSPAGPGLA
jgi:ATP-dependent helicase/nuclease subunit A